MIPMAYFETDTENYAQAPMDGSAWLGSNSGDCSLRVFRGGSWDNGSGSLRSANRGADDAGLRDDRIGFRVARTFAP